MPVETNGGGLEQRLSGLQEQIEQLRRTSAIDRRPLEERLATLTEFGAAILRRWAATADRHAAAVSQFEAHLRGLGDAGSQMQHDTSQRLLELERIIQQEWDALRKLHEAPVKQLVEQASNLTEVSIATANSAQHGFDRAEARLSALEAEFRQSTSELTREVHNAVAELRTLSQAASRQLTGETPAWPLEDVTRLHTQLRETEGVHVTAQRALPATSDSAATTVEPSKDSVSSAVDLVKDSPAAAVEPPHYSPITAVEPSNTWGSRRVAVAAAVAVLVIAAGAFAWRLERDVRASAEQVNESQRQLRAATETAARQVAEKQDEATRALSAAQEMATRAQMIGDVLAAPDVVRFPLVGHDALAAATGQVLWSRSRGVVVFSASGLPAPPQDSTYQFWLLTRMGAVSAATFVPDTSGRVTVAATPKTLPPLVGAIVTMEHKGGNDTPSGEPLLTRVPVPAPTS
jgi:anti-sigma-K factor RskA